MAATHNAEAESTRRAVIGKGLDDALVSEASKILGEAISEEIYRQYPDAHIAWEALERKDITYQVVETWLKNEDNIRRVAEFSGQSVPDASRLLAHYSAIRIKKLKAPSILRKGFANSKAKIAVLIALNKWNKENGFFREDVGMQSGEDILLNGDEAVRFPGTAGGLVIILYLHRPSGP